MLYTVRAMGRSGVPFLLVFIIVSAIEVGGTFVFIGAVAKLINQKPYFASVWDAEGLTY